MFITVKHFRFLEYHFQSKYRKVWIQCLREWMHYIFIVAYVHVHLLINVSLTSFNYDVSQSTHESNQKQGCKMRFLSADENDRIVSLIWKNNSFYIGECGNVPQNITLNNIADSKPLDVVIRSVLLIINKKYLPFYIS